MQATKQGVLALTQARGEIAFSVVPVHYMHYYMQSSHCQPFFCSGEFAQRVAAGIFNPCVGYRLGPELLGAFQEFRV